MIGGVIGALIGLKFGGFFGMLFGGLLGHYVANAMMEPLGGGSSTQRQRVQQQYFRALFICLGKIAKADGVVTRDEIDRCELIIRRMNLNSDQRASAIEFFNLGKQSDMDLSGPLGKLNAEARGSFAIKQMFMEMLLEVAASRNQIDKSEWQVMLQICQHLRFSQSMLITLARMRGFNVGAEQNQSDNHSYQKYWKKQVASDDSYRVLGVKPSDSKAVIRKTYKKLMSTHHPDKLIAKGVPPEMINVAKEKTQEIQQAWEEIKKQRGF